MGGDRSQRGARWTMGRRIAGAAVTMITAAAMLPFLGATAHAVAAQSPTDPFYGFPASYVDAAGVRLAPCLTPGLCPTAPPNLAAPPTVPDNFPDFGVYESADARGTAGNVDLRYITSLTFAFAGETPPASGQQIVFGRVRIRVKNLTPLTQYTITHPYGVLTATANAGGTIDTTTDTGCVLAPCNFASALASPVAQHFLQWDTGAPAGFIGDGASPHAVTGSPNGTNFVRVAGPNAGGLGVNTFTVDQFIVAGQIATTPYARPSVPQALAAAAGPGGGEITLSWTPPASTGGLISGYNVFRSPDGVAWTQVATTGAVTTFTDHGLGTRQTAHYKIAALNPAGQGPITGEVSATTFDLPGAPRSLTGQAGPGAHDITVDWSAPAANGGSSVTSYNVYRLAPGGAWSLLTTVPATSTDHRDSTVAEGTTYQYAVTAVTAAGEGPRSSSTSVTSFARPSAPQSTVASAGPGAHEVSVAWDVPATDGGTPVTSYQVERATGDGAFAPLGGVIAADARSFSDTTVAERTTYRYRVRAINIVAPSAPSAPLTVTSFGKPAAPAEVHAQSGMLPQQITVSWPGTPDDGGTPVTAWDVYRLEGSDWVAVGHVDGATLSFTDTPPGVNVAKPFRYSVSATNIVGTSPRSSAQGCSATFPWVDTTITNALICG